MSRDFPRCESCQSNEQVLVICKQCYETLDKENEQLVQKVAMTFEEIKMTFEEINETSGLTPREEKCLHHLSASYGVFLDLPIQHPDDMRDFVDAVHRIQDLIAMRIARRLFPGYWKTQDRKPSCAGV